MLNLAAFLRKRLQARGEPNHNDLTLSSSPAALLAKHLQPKIETASLEVTSVSLPEKIREFALEAKAEGFTKVRILPLFLLAGIHVREDLPAAINLAQQTTRGTIEIELMEYLGNYPNLAKVVAGQFEELPEAGRILISHGSRRQGANQPLERLAKTLDAVNAYWSVNLSLQTQIQSLVETGIKKIAIIPYFIFTGGITEAIAQQVKNLQILFPQVQLFYGQPLASNPQLTDLIVEIFS